MTQLALKNPPETSTLLRKLEEIESKIQLTPKAEQSINYLDIDQLIDYLPSRPAKPTVYRLAQDGKIPCFKLNGKLIFDRTEIDAWIRSKRQPTADQLEGGLSS